MPFVVHGGLAFLAIVPSFFLVRESVPIENKGSNKSKEDQITTRALLAMMLEAKAIGDYLGLRLRVDIERRIDGAGALGPHKMSMLQDLERGRSMEVEPLVGVIQELGLYTGIPTPTTDVVLALIRQRAQHATAALH